MSEPQGAKLEHLLGLALDSQAGRTLRLVLRLAIAIAAADEGSLLVYDPARNDLCFVMTEGDRESELALRGQRVPLGNGPVGLAAATLEVHTGAPIFRDIHQSERLIADGRRPEAEIAAPVVVEGRLFGVLTAVAFEPARRFGAQDARRYGGFALIVGVIVEQAQRLHPAHPEEDTRPQRAGASERRIARVLDRVAAHRPGAMASLASIVEHFGRAVLDGHEP